MQNQIIKRNFLRISLNILSAIMKLYFCKHKWMVFRQDFLSKTTRGITIRQAVLDFVFCYKIEIP